MDWLFQTLYEMKLNGQNFKVHGLKADMDGRFVYCSSGELELTQHEGFTGLDLSKIEGLPLHYWHLKATTKPARIHRIATLLVPIKHGEPKYVSYFMEDQGFDTHMYFTEDGVTHRVEVPKAY